MTWSVSGRGECYESGERTRSVLSRSGSTFGVLLGSLLLLEDSLELVLDVLEEGWDAKVSDRFIRAYARRSAGFHSPGMLAVGGVVKVVDKEGKFGILER